MINNKTQEKQQMPRIFELWEKIMNGSEEEKKKG